MLRTTTIFCLVALPSLALIPQLAQAQDTASPTPASLALKFAPLATQDPITSTLQFDLEYRFRSHWGVEVGYGKQFESLKYTSLGLTDDRHNYKYAKYRAEVRYYLSPDSLHPNRNVYVGLQPFYTPQRYTRYGNNYYDKGRYVTYDRALVEKDIMGFALKSGMQWQLRHNWLVEAGIGLGARYVDVRYETQNERKAVGFGESQANRFNQIEKPETKINLHVEVGFKVGYRLSW